MNVIHALTASFALVSFPAMASLPDQRYASSLGFSKSSHADYVCSNPGRGVIVGNTAFQSPDGRQLEIATVRSRTATIKGGDDITLEIVRVEPCPR